MPALSTLSLYVPRIRSDVLAEPSDALAIPCLRSATGTPPLRASFTLSHNHTAHEHFDGPNALERHLALAGCLVQSKHLPQLILAYRVGVVDLVAKYDEGCAGQLLHSQQSIELGLGLAEALVVFRVDKEDDAADFGEVITPEAAGLCVAAKVKGGKLDVAYRELFRSCGVSEGRSAEREGRIVLG